MVAYYNGILNRAKLPEYEWAVQEDGSIKVTTATQPREVYCGNAPTRRDGIFASR